MPARSASAPADPPPNCARCPRLVAYREENRGRQPGWHNAPVPSCGDAGAELLVVGLAPGLKGANRTGRVFTGDQAGVLLFAQLADFGWAQGHIADRPDDGLDLKGAVITNALRCAPPDNRPLAAELRACRPYLAASIASLPRLRVILALGRVAHEAVLRSQDLALPRFRFSHGARHRLPGLTLFDSFHCSRYNVNTGRLTPGMFAEVLAAIRHEFGN